MKKLLKVVLSLLLACSFLAGCSSNETEEEEDVATYALVSGWNTLQFGHYSETGYYGPMVWGQLFETLVTVTDNGYEAKGAKSWDISADGTVITLKLDETTKFSDGTNVTAKDYVYSMALISDPDFGAPDYVKFNVLLKGTDETGLAVSGEQFGAVAKDDYTLELSFKEPITLDAFLSDYQNLYIYAVPSHVFEGKSVKEVATSDFWSKPTVTSGPWTVESHVVNSALTLVANPDYHLGAPKLDKLIMTVLDSSNFASALMSGSVDYVYPAVDPKQGATLQSVDSVNVEVSEYPLTTHMFYMNNKTLPLEVRTAIAMAIDRKLIVEQLFGGGAVVSNSWIVYGSDQYNNDLGDRFDVEAAKQKLVDAGWDFDRTLKIGTVAGTRADIATIIQQNLTAIGMKVEVTNLTAGAMYGAAIGGSVDCITAQGYAILGSPFYANYNISAKNPDATCIHNTNPVFDEYEAKYNAATTDSERLQIVMDYQKDIYELVPFVQVCSVYDYKAYAKRLGGIDASLSSHTSDNTWQWYIVK